MVNSISWNTTRLDSDLRDRVMQEIAKNNIGFAAWAKQAFSHYLDCEENSSLLSNIDEADTFFNEIESFRYTEKIRCVIDSKSGHYRIPRNNPCANLKCDYDSCNSYKLYQKAKLLVGEIDWQEKSPDTKFLMRFWQDLALRFEEWAMSPQTRDLFKNQILNYEQERDELGEIFLYTAQERIKEAGYTLKSDWVY